MRITTILAGNSTKSNSQAILEAFTRGITESNPLCTIQSFTLKDLTIEQFSLKYYAQDTPLEKDFLALRESIQHSQGLVIATPIWNFSVPAHLKNLIDRMGSFAFDPVKEAPLLSGLPLVILYTGGAPEIAWKTSLRFALSHIRLSLEYFGYSVVNELFIPKCTPGRGVFGFVMDQRPEELLKAQREGVGFVRHVQHYERTGTSRSISLAKGQLLRFLEWIMSKVL